MRALEQAGYTADDMIGVGVNGQIACEEFKKPEVTGFKGSIYVDSAIHGATAIRELHDHVTKGEPIPERTIIAGTLITKDDNENIVRQELTRGTPIPSLGPGEEI